MRFPPEEFRDSRCYQEYTLASFENQLRLPLIKTTSRLIAAVVRNQVDILRQVLDEPRWCYVSDVEGYSLLHIAIICYSVEVFDHMMTIPEFPLEFVDRFNKTALMFAIHGFFNPRDNVSTNEHLTNELIMKGANIPQNCCEDSTPLICCIGRLYVRTPKLLMERGVDVNAAHGTGYTPLAYTIFLSENNLEILLTLLMYGAKPSISLFENAVLYNKPEILVETIFLLLFDEFSTFETQLNVLIKLAKERFVFFDELLTCSDSITFTTGCGYYYFCALCDIDAYYLRLIVSKHGTLVGDALFSVNFIIREVNLLNEPITLENVAILLESDARPATLFLLRNMNRFVPFCALDYIIRSQRTDVEEFYLLFLSYGFHVTAEDLDFAYRLSLLNCNNYFEILLHMDIQTPASTRISAMPALIYNVNMELETILQNPGLYCFSANILRFFRHPRLTEICNVHHRLRGTEHELNLPKVPLLLELARNRFRRYFINRFNITTFGGFYSHVQSLDMSITYKKIILYELPLYR